MWHDLQLPLLNAHDIHFTRVLLNVQIDPDRAHPRPLHITLYTLPGTRVAHTSTRCTGTYTFYTSCR